MKTKLFAKTQSQEKSTFELLSDTEMKEVQGGAKWILVRDEDGNLRVIFYP